MDRRTAPYGVAAAALVALLAGCSGGGGDQGQGGQEGEVPPAPPAQQQEQTPAPPPSPDPAAAKTALQQQIDQALAQSPITFEADSADLTEQGEQTAKKAAELAKSAPQELKFTITGYVADTGNPSPKDQELSQQRAQAVADAFTEAGVPKERLEVVGKGTAEGGTEQDRHATIAVQ
ncbi:OmpA family protein [Saccharopolyspora sp. 6V]|uniref:OmpA family protein n=1 Tax=Saccharopolyspora sp. 6V TaxID=2877239 RepID=UPI001CD2E28E|nr:OmpA family protein [Saccharopolyspora sp. 6V]MCA1195006.1 OmpA family protein [Saccharopolyspora sp. 6V]